MGKGKRGEDVDAKTCKHTKDIDLSELRKGLKDAIMAVCSDCEEKRPKPAPAVSKALDGSKGLFVCLTCGRVMCPEHACAHAMDYPDTPHNLVLQTDTFTWRCLHCHTRPLPVPPIVASCPKPFRRFVDACTAVRKRCSPKSGDDDDGDGDGGGEDATPEAAPSVSAAAASASVTAKPVAAAQRRKGGLVDHVPPGVVGLANLGNTCFFNSVMQNLIQLTPLVHYFLDAAPALPRLVAQLPVPDMAAGAAASAPASAATVPPGKSAPTEAASSKGGGRSSRGGGNSKGKAAATAPTPSPTSEGALCAALRGLVHAVHGPGAEAGATHAPRAIFGALGARIARYRNYQQQDAHELLRNLLDIADSEDVRQQRALAEHAARAAAVAAVASARADAEAAAAEATAAGELEVATALRTSAAEATAHQVPAPPPPLHGRMRSFVSKTFEGELLSSVTCHYCGMCSTTFEPFLDLSLPLAQPTQMPPASVSMPFAAPAAPTARPPSTATSAAATPTPANPNPAPAAASGTPPSAPPAAGAATSASSGLAASPSTVYASTGGEVAAPATAAPSAEGQERADAALAAAIAAGEGDDDVGGDDFAGDGADGDSELAASVAAAEAGGQDGNEKPPDEGHVQKVTKERKRAQKQKRQAARRKAHPRSAPPKQALSANAAAQPTSADSAGQALPSATIASNASSVVQPIAAAAGPPPTPAMAESNGLLVPAASAASSSTEAPPSNTSAAPPDVPAAASTTTPTTLAQGAPPASGYATGGSGAPAQAPAVTTAAMGGGDSSTSTGASAAPSAPAGLAAAATSTSVTAARDTPPATATVVAGAASGVAKTGFTWPPPLRASMVPPAPVVALPAPCLPPSPVGAPLSLEGCLNSFFWPETLQGTETYGCQECTRRRKIEVLDNALFYIYNLLAKGVPGSDPAQLRVLLQHFANIAHQRTLLIALAPRPHMPPRRAERPPLRADAGEGDGDSTVNDDESASGTGDSEGRHSSGAQEAGDTDPSSGDEEESHGASDKGDDEAGAGGGKGAEGRPEAASGNGEGSPRCGESGNVSASGDKGEAPGRGASDGGEGGKPATEAKEPEAASDGRTSQQRRSKNQYGEEGDGKMSGRSQEGDVAAAAGDPRSPPVQQAHPPLTATAGATATPTMVASVVPAPSPLADAMASLSLASPPVPAVMPPAAMPPAAHFFLGFPGCPASPAPEATASRSAYGLAVDVQRLVAALPYPLPAPVVGPRLFTTDRHIRRPATKQFLLHGLPPVLVIHLKRFGGHLPGGGHTGRRGSNHHAARTYTSNAMANPFSSAGGRRTRSGGGGGTSLRKLDTFVGFPLVLDMAPFVAWRGTPPKRTASGTLVVGDETTPPGCPCEKPIEQHQGGTSTVYRLNGLAIHSGSLLGGHYTAYTHRRGAPEDEWFYYSDSSFHRVTLDEILRAEAYLLFYEQIPGDSAVVHDRPPIPPDN